MRVLVCGGRDFCDRELLDGVLNRLAEDQWIDCLIEGDARGTDRLAGAWAERNGIDVEKYPADWARFGLAAGPRRNQRMIKDGRPDLVVAFPGGVGTADMVRRAKVAGIRVVSGAR